MNNVDTFIDHLKSNDINIANCKHYDLKDITSMKSAMFCKHNNINSVPAKFDRLTEIIMTFAM